MAFKDFVDLADGQFEAHKVFAPMVGQRHLGEHGQHLGQFVQSQLRTVASDVASLLEPLDANQARAGRQSHRVGQVDIGDTSVLLQLAQDAKVEAVKFEVVSHESV